MNDNFYYWLRIEILSEQLVNIQIISCEIIETTWIMGELEFITEVLQIASDWLNTILSNIERTQTSFFEHWTNSNVFIFG